MVNESVTFGLSSVATVVGSLVMLYGVSLNAGQRVNTPMLIGIGIVLLAITIHTLGIMGLEDPHGGA